MRRGLESAEECPAKRLGFVGTTGSTGSRMIALAAAPVGVAAVVRARVRIRIRIQGFRQKIVAWRCQWRRLIGRRNGSRGTHARMRAKADCSHSTVQYRYPLVLGWHLNPALRPSHTPGIRRHHGTSVGRFETEPTHPQKYLHQLAVV